MIPIEEMANVDSSNVYVQCRFCRDYQHFGRPTSIYCNQAVEEHMMVHHRKEYEALIVRYGQIQASDYIKKNTNPIIREDEQAPIPNTKAVTNVNKSNEQQQKLTWRDKVKNALNA